MEKTVGGPGGPENTLEGEALADARVELTRSAARANARKAAEPIRGNKLAKRLDKKRRKRRIG